MRYLLDALGNPQPTLPGVLIAGTNGKGSVAALIDAVCRAAGLRTVLLTKPHLHTIEERIRIDGGAVSGKVFAELSGRVADAAADLDPALGDVIQAEWLTAMGALAAQANPDAILIAEVGMGGRYDATSLLDLPVKVITSISLDHTEVLGHTIAAIAAEKAAIIRPGDDVVAACGVEALPSVLEPPAATRCVIGDDLRVMDVVCGPRGTSLVLHDAGAPLALRTALLGPHQATNVAAAVAACRLLALRGIAIDNDAIGHGVATATWQGRLQWAGNLLIDGAHNPGALTALREALPLVTGGRPVAVVAGFLTSPRLAEIAAAVRAIDEAATFTTVLSPRTADPEELARLCGPAASVATGLRDGIARARQRTPDGVVLVCGSLSLVAEALQL